MSRSIEEDESRQKKNLHLLEQTTRLNLQKTEIETKALLKQKKAEFEEKIEREQKRIKNEKERLDHERKSVSKQIQEVTELKQKLTHHIESLHSQPLEELITILASNAFHQKRKEAEAQYTLEMNALERDAKSRASEILITALERGSLPTTKEFITISVPITTQELLPQIIGRDGRTIKRFEELTGTHVVIDEQNLLLNISSSNGKRRASAAYLASELFKLSKISLKILDELFLRAEEAFEQAHIDRIKHSVREIGCVTLPELPPQILKKLSEMEHFSSLGQNLFLHSIEVARIAQNMSLELKLSPQKATLIGLLHDIGKVLPHDSLSHALSGARFVRECGLHEEISNGIAAHHKEVVPKTPEARLIPIADAISAALPGARSVTLNELIEKSNLLEEAARLFPGVLQAYCLSGGKELHLVVNENTRKTLLDPIQKEAFLKHFPTVQTLILHSP